MSSDDEREPAWSDDERECTHAHTEDDSCEGHVVCRECGLVLRPVFSGDVESRNPDAARSDYHPSARGAARGAEGTFISGNSLLAKMNRSTHRGDRVEREEYELIERICGTLHLNSQVVSTGFSMLQTVRAETGVWRGARRVAVRAACISIACAHLCVGISDGEIAGSALVQLPIKTMNRQKKVALAVLHGARQYQSHTRYSSEFGRRFCARLRFDRFLTSAVCTRAEAFDSKSRLQSKPCNMIVTVSVIDICLRCERSPTTLSRLCEVANVTAPTMAKWYADATRTNFARSRCLLRMLKR